MRPARTGIRGSAANDWEMMGKRGNDYMHEAEELLRVVKSLNVLLERTVQPEWVF